MSREIKSYRYNSTWTLDAHCDSIYKKHLFKNDLELSKETINIPKDVLDRIAVAFGEEILLSPGDYPTHVTLSRLRQGNVGAVFMNVGDMDLQASRDMILGLNERFVKNICGLKLELEVVQAYDTTIF